MTSFIKKVVDVIHRESCKSLIENKLKKKKTQVVIEKVEGIFPRRRCENNSWRNLFLTFLLQVCLRTNIWIVKIN